MNTRILLLLLATLTHHALPAKPSGFGIDGVRPYTIRVTRFHCLDMPYRQIDMRVCRIQLRRNQPSVFYFELDIPTLFYEVYATFRTNYKINNQYRPMLIDYTIEFCSLLNAKPGTNPMAEYILDTVRALVPNAIQPCPYGNKYYNFTGFTMDEKFFPNAIPAGDWRADLHVRDKNNETLVRTEIYIAVRSKGISSLSLMEW